MGKFTSQGTSYKGPDNRWAEAGANMAQGMIDRQKAQEEQNKELAKLQKIQEYELEQIKAGGQQNLLHALIQGGQFTVGEEGDPGVIEMPGPDGKPIYLIPKQKETLMDDKQLLEHEKEARAKGQNAVDAFQETEAGMNASKETLNAIRKAAEAEYLLPIIPKAQFPTRLRNYIPEHIKDKLTLDPKSSLYDSTVATVQFPPEEEGGVPRSFTGTPAEIAAAAKKTGVAPGKPIAGDMAYEYKEKIDTEKKDNLTVESAFRTGAKTLAAISRGAGETMLGMKPWIMNQGQNALSGISQGFGGPAFSAPEGSPRELGRESIFNPFTAFGEYSNAIQGKPNAMGWNTPSQYPQQPVNPQELEAFKALAAQQGMQQGMQQ